MEEMKISVVMSCYNSERFLRQSIDSILMQSYREFEFIIGTMALQIVQKK